MPIWEETVKHYALFGILHIMYVSQTEHKIKIIWTRDYDQLEKIEYSFPSNRVMIRDRYSNKEI